MKSIRTTDTSAGILLLLLFGSVPLQSQESAPFPPPPDNVNHIAVLADQKEPGERITITGTVYKSDGKTPAAGFVLYFYQTDATGVYNRTDGSYRTPRLHGWAKTDQSGSYEVRTIKPGSYPKGRNPAHIHVTAPAPGGKTEWLSSFLFEGDPYLSKIDQQRPDRDGCFSPVLRFHRSAQGTLVARRDILIQSLQ